MASSRLIQLLSRKLVKPSISTQPSLRNYKLSLLDQLMENKYMPIAFFYPNQQNRHIPDRLISSALEQSLSKTLASYYPFAGRLTNNISISCNDMGASFMEARIRSTMSEILEEDDTKAQDIVFPSGLPWSSVVHDRHSPLVVAQLSHFDCGGKAISVCMSHKIGDAYTLCNFINDWAAMARHERSCDHHHQEKPSPQFVAASILPPIENDSSIGDDMDLKQRQHGVITRRFVFGSEELSQLKASAAAKLGLHKPTAVEVVSALLYKSAMAASMECSGSFKPSVLALIVNLRPLLELPNAQNCVGNLASNFTISTADETEVDFSTLTNQLRREKLKYYKKYKGIKTNDLVSATLDKAKQITMLHGKNDIDEYICSSFCRFPTYHTDFGLGRPIRVSLAALPVKNFFVLIDNHNMDGIEALVTLEEQVMSVFQCDPELLAFASLG